MAPFAKRIQIYSCIGHAIAYRGTAQTELGRCKLYPAGSDAKPLATAMRKHCKAQGCDVPAWAWTAAQKKRAVLVDHLLG